VTKGALGLMLKHPLVIQAVLMSGVANEMYLRKKAAYEAAVSQGEWSKALIIVERPWRLQYLASYWRAKLVALDQLRELLTWVWQDIEFPSHYGVRLPMLLFRAAGFLSDKPGLVRRGRLPERLCLYRGCGGKPYERHLSWTWALCPTTAHSSGRSRSQASRSRCLGSPRNSTQAVTSFHLRSQMARRARRSSTLSRLLGPWRRSGARLPPWIGSRGSRQTSHRLATFSLWTSWMRCGFA
jgi:hypothetical protein